MVLYLTEIMKNLTLIVGIFLLTIQLQAQEFKSIVNSIVKGEFDSLELDELVDYCFENDQDLLEPAELRAALGQTIENLNPVSTEILHIADSKDNASKYAVVQVKSSAGQLYRMFVYTAESKIVEIRFNKE